MCVVLAITGVLFGVGGQGRGGKEMCRIIFVKIWGLIGEMVKHWKEQTTNDDLVLCPEYFLSF